MKTNTARSDKYLYGERCNGREKGGLPRELNALLEDEGIVYIRCPIAHHPHAVQCITPIISMESEGPVSGDSITRGSGQEKG